MIKMRRNRKIESPAPNVVAYWRDSGSNPAGKTVQNWKSLPRPNFCEAATSPICHHVRRQRATAQRTLAKFNLVV